MRQGINAYMMRTLFSFHTMVRLVPCQNSICLGTHHITSCKLVVVYARIS